MKTTEELSRMSPSQLAQEERIAYEYWGIVKAILAFKNSPRK